MYFAGTVYWTGGVMARYGGCGLIPSGVYHQELPTTVEDRRVDAPRVLPIHPGSRSDV